MITAISALFLCSSTLGPAKPLPVLVFSKTTSYRHGCIPVAQKSLKEHESKYGIAFKFSEDAQEFSAANLKQYKSIVFLCTTGDILNAAQQKAFEEFIESGGGFVGVHSAADTEYDWPFYGECCGAYFLSHPAIQKATVRIESSSHPITMALPKVWERTDEWYDYRKNPRPFVEVLATVDEKSYSGGKMGADHPIMWCQSIGKGRSFYTGFGHTDETYSDPIFMSMLGRAIKWSARWP